MKLLFYIQYGIPKAILDMLRKTLKFKSFSLDYILIYILKNCVCSKSNYIMCLLTTDTKKNNVTVYKGREIKKYQERVSLYSLQFPPRGIGFSSDCPGLFICLVWFRSRLIDSYAPYLAAAIPRFICACSVSCVYTWLANKSLSGV